MENIMNRFDTPEFKKNYEVSHEIFHKKVTSIEEELILQDQMTDEARLYLDLVKNEELLKELVTLEKKEDFKVLFSQHGLNFSDEEIDQLVDGIIASTRSMLANNGELTEDELEMIAGGGFGSWIKGRFSSVGKALVTVGIAVAAIGLCVFTGGGAVAAVAASTAAAVAAGAGGITLTAGVGLVIGGAIAQDIPLD